MLDVALKDFSWITKNFFKVLIDNNQIENLLEIYIEFIEFYQDKNNIRFFEVYSAEELSEKEIQMISNKLQRIYSSTIEIKTFVDESLIGGLRINHNGVALDNTLLNQLEILKAIL